jgi:hypothetical protein
MVNLNRFIVIIYFKINKNLYSREKTTDRFEQCNNRSLYRMIHQ